MSKYMDMYREALKRKNYRKVIEAAYDKWLEEKKQEVVASLDSFVPDDKNRAMQKWSKTIQTFQAATYLRKRENWDNHVWNSFSRNALTHYITKRVDYKKLFGFSGYSSYHNTHERVLKRIGPSKMAERVIRFFSNNPEQMLRDPVSGIMHWSMVFDNR